MSSDTRQEGELFNPFPGLRPFTRKEHHLFFGREGQSNAVLQSLEKNDFVAVIGASGSGKSSLIYCGVIPELEKESKQKLLTVATRPGTSPVKNLIKSFAEEIKDKEVPDASDFLAGNKSLKDWIKGKIPSGHSLLIVVDQFEEIFRYSGSADIQQEEEEVQLFVETIYECCTDQNSGIVVVLTMRSDFIGECSVFQDLTELINRSNYLIPQMTREDFRKAIEGPVAKGGATI